MTRTCCWKPCAWARASPWSVAAWSPAPSPRAAWCNWATSACPTPIPTGWSGRSASRRATPPGLRRLAARGGPALPGRATAAQRMKLRLISRKRSLPARSIHSKATISRDTIIAPAWRIRSTASACRSAAASRSPPPRRTLRDHGQAGRARSAARRRAPRCRKPRTAGGRRRARAAGAVGGGREVQLLEDLRGLQLIAQGRHRRPQALAVLLAGQHRHVQCAGHAQQPLAVLDQRRTVVDGRQQAFLDIDHQQGRGCGADQHGVLLRFDVSVRLA